MTGYARFALLLLLTGVGCGRNAPPAAPPTAPPVAPPVVVAPPAPGGGEPKQDATIVLANGLDAAQRQALYHVAEGSEVYPLEWMRALKSKATGKPFLEDIERFHFLADPDNPDGLPIGMTADLARGLEPLGRMIGINCAACHVGQLTFQGKSVRIDGAPNFLNTREFFADLVESALATVADPNELLAFQGRLNARPDNADQPAPGGVAGAARRLFHRIGAGAEKDVAKLLAPLVKRLVEREQAEPYLDLSKTVAQPSDAPELRKRILGGFEAAAKDLLDKSTLLAPALKAIEEGVDKQDTLRHSLEETYLSLRLLRARAEFLKKLGMVGKDKRTDWGPGRVDAFGSARAFLFQPGYPPLSPVSYPPMWKINQLTFIHYDGNTTSVLERNLGQALGMGAVYDPKTFASTLRVDNIHRLEGLVRKIQPPSWPEDVLGKIDPERATRGKALYVEHCAKCHPLLKSDEMFPDQLEDLKSIATDPVRATSFAENLPDGTPFVDAIRDAMHKIRNRALDDMKASTEFRAEIDRVKVMWRATGKYAQRPLYGVWATAPYLHNGSVPTMDDLLRPAKERPAQFYVGHREYDPVKMGYVSQVDGKKSNFDTSTPGNSNAGHEYGVTLTAEQRRDLIEYLKTN